MPKNVQRFEWLLYSAIALGLLSLLRNPSALAPILALESTNVFLFAYFIVAFASVEILFVVFIWLTARRRKNWARWTLVLFFAAGIPFEIYQMANEKDHVTVVIVAAISSMHGLAYFFIFSGDARPWFRQPQTQP